jgi:pyruvate kinase
VKGCIITTVEEQMSRKAKIVCTIGPASQDEDTLRALLLAGMDVARLNFSHGRYEDHEQICYRIRRVSHEAGRAVCILQDLQGPKIRTGAIPGDKMVITSGQEVTLVTRPILDLANTIPVDFEELPASVRPGGRILLDDGNMELQVLDTGVDHVRAKVIVGGVLESHKGINLPGASLAIHAMTEKDQADLEFGLKLGVDAVALSFVRTAQDIHQLKDAISQLAPQRVGVPVIAKLERPESLDNLDEIIRLADGVMVARGDLGVEMSPQEVPAAQKRIIACANHCGKLVITATQMLDSMIQNPRPTRAEASDVANAILDGTDAVMLSGETAVGEYPLATVEMMNSIVCQAETHMSEWGHWHGPDNPEWDKDDSFYLTLAARELAHDRNVSAIAAFTISGRTAVLLSKVRPSVPILAFTPYPETYTRLGMYWGVIPYLVPHVSTIHAMLTDVEKAILTDGSVEVGQQVVLICGFPVDQIRPTNLALLHTIGSVI